MALQIITGPSGSGKTTYGNQLIMEQAQKNPDTFFYVIVPEQLNLVTQQAFLELSETKTLFNVDVITFDRFAERVVGRLGMELPELVDDTGKCLLLRKVAEDVKEDLTVFKRPIRNPGFIQLMKSMLSELLQYNISNEKLEELSKTEDMPVGLKRKLTDMTKVFGTFHAALDTGIPTESLLSYVNRLLPKMGLQNCVFLFDGYTGFTPIQELLLKTILSMAKMVYVTVTIDRDGLNTKKMDSYDLFYMSHVMISRLYGLAEKANAKVLSPVVLENNQRTKKDDLRFLEKALFRNENYFFEDEPTSITITEMASPLEEVRCVAEKIYHLISEKQYRYRDIAVITGNMDAYSPHIARVFTQAGFSYFMDNKKNIRHMPAVTYILSALKAISGNADYENMFSFIKTGIILSAEEYSILENYVLAKGIRGFTSWQREWKKEMRDMQGFTLEQINSYRERVIENLLPLRDCLLREDSTVTDGVTAIVEMMLKDDVFQYLENQRSWYEDQKDPVKESLYEQMWDKIMEVFDQFVQTLGNKHLEVEEYYDILLAGFCEIKAGTIPATKDCIVVGDMERTRIENNKVLFFLGLNEGNVPSFNEKVDLLNKQDRDILAKDYEVELTPSQDTKLSYQKYYFYLMVTKASERLYLSFSETDNQGSSLNPSGYMRDLRKIFSMDERYSEPGEYYINDATMLDMFASELRNLPKKGITNLFKEIAGALWTREHNRDMMLEMIHQAFFTYDGKNIGFERAKNLYGSQIIVSPTRLQTEASCPFAHFLKHGLGIGERDQFEVSQKDMGNIYHMALETFFKNAKRDHVNWMELSEADRQIHLDACLKELSETYKDSLFRSSAKNQYFVKRIGTVLSNAIGILAKQIDAAGYIVKDVEVKFSGMQSEELKFPLKNGTEMVISGRVDRMDVKETQKGEEDCIYAKVIDYKTGSTTFDATLAYNGLQMQLIYMDAATGILKKENPGKLVESGGFAFFQIKDSYTETTGGETLEQLESKRMKDMEMSGIINLSAEPDVPKNGVKEETLSKISSHIRQKADELGNEIITGNVSTSPYKRKDSTACDFCPYKAVCGFDDSLHGYKYRLLRERAKEEF